MEEKGLNYDENAYRIPKENVGLAVIFNNENFKGKPKKRNGADKDQKVLVVVLEQLGFRVEVYENLTKPNADKKIQELAVRDFTKDSCFLAIFMSHGYEDKVQMSCNRALHIKDDILDPFRGHECKDLIGKPKIFIFETCRGLKTEEATILNEPLSLESNATIIQSEVVQRIYIPAGADFLSCFASDSGRVAYRDPKSGSWFIQTFAAVIQHYINNPDPAMDFVSLMTVVTRKVSEKYFQLNGEGQSLMQIPCVVSTLKKKIHFPKLCNTAKKEASANSKE